MILYKLLLLDTNILIMIVQKSLLFDGIMLNHNLAQNAWNHNFVQTIIIRWECFK